VQSVSIIGVGKLGGALSIALDDAGWPVRELIVRGDKIAKKIRGSYLTDARVLRASTIAELSSPIVVIAVDDSQISGMASSISGLVSKRHVVFHTSGSLSSSELGALATSGAAIGSIHPLASISDPLLGAKQFYGTYFCVEGDKKAVRLGRRMVRSLGGHPFFIDGSQKALYHAGAVTAAGHVTALISSAVEMLGGAGIDKSTAKKILLPLAQSAVSNLARQEPAEALTGTFARLDVSTFERHIRSMSGLPEQIVHLYLELGDRSLVLVEEREGTSRELENFRKAISVAKRKLGC
jgi:predicted short-subunit dehydrogenase-like oxidoreductase (DUF2520 family)